MGQAVTTKGTETDLPDRLRAYLEDVAAGGVPVTYAQAARNLDLERPHSIHRVAKTLEHLMAEDAAASRPFIAALVISRARHGLPALGFFDAAWRLGRFRSEPEGVEAWAFHRAEFKASQSYYGRAGAAASNKAKNMD